MAVVNRGRQIQFINGINGVSLGGNVQVNMDVNKRYHRNTLQCSSLNYTGGTGLTVVALTGAGTGATANVTAVNGVVTAVALSGTNGAGFVTGDTVTVTDKTGKGLVLTVTAAAGAITAYAITSTGTASPTNPALFFNTILQRVNGVIVRDITPDSIMRILSSNNRLSRLGELPLLYTEEYFNINQLNELLSWDMAGQSTFSINGQINPVRSNPIGLIGVTEFDTDRNVRPSGGSLVPFLQPVTQHEQTFNITAGLNLINTIRFDYPIRRLWFKGATAGQITQLEVDQDGNKVFEATFEQMLEMYVPYGFQFGQPNFFNQNYATSFALAGAFNPPVYFDFAYIADLDGRVNKVLTCENSLVLRVNSAVAQQLTVVVEALPGQYAA
jgi:hypothetical protein